MTMEPDPSYYGTVTFAGKAVELWRARWKSKRTEFTRWFAKYPGSTEDENAFRDSRGDTPGAALGNFILNLPENDDLTNRIYR
jgi:hypothetical protein